VMVTYSTNINKTNNHLSPSLIKYKMTMTYDVGNPYRFYKLSELIQAFCHISCSVTSIWLYEL